MLRNIAVWALLPAMAACGSRVAGVEADDAGAQTDTGSAEETGTGSTSTSDTGTSSDSGEESGYSTGFVPTPDAVDEERCDVLQQDCPEGEKCSWYATAGSSWDAEKCVPILGDGQVGDPCQGFGENPGVSGLDDCAKGHMCWEIDPDTGVGYCVEYCHGSYDNPQCNEGICAIYGSGFGFCVLTCDPLEVPPDCPNPDNVCIPDPGGTGFVCVLDASGGMGTAGTQCQYANACNQGLLCTDAAYLPNCDGAQGCCAELCDLDLPDMCPDQDLGVECVPYYEFAPPGYENVGVCVIPA